jgi:type IV secretion system protein VirB1
MMNPFIQLCAPPEHAAMMQKIIAAESGGNSLAIHDNKSGKSFFPNNLSEALAIARKLMAQKDASVDLGLAQINSRNLPRFNASLEDAFDPCSSIKMGSTIFAEALQNARNAGLSGDAAIRAALSQYNTGRLNSTVGAAYASGVLGGRAIVAVNIQNIQNAPILVDLKSNNILVSFNP